MSPLVRLGLLVLFADELVVGAWNAAAPRSFYDYFPTVDLTPPYSEHYARDFGGATLGIALLLGVAALRPEPRLVALAAAAYTIFAVLHFGYHLVHLHGATSAQAAGLTVTNAAVAVIGLALLLASLRRLVVPARSE